jgi:hypothetical protein
MNNKEITKNECMDDVGGHCRTGHVELFTGTFYLLMISIGLAALLLFSHCRRHRR